MPQIVTVNVSQQLAPAPSTLQQTGAFISQGGTNTAPGTLSPLTQPSDLTPLLQVAAGLASLTASGTTATATLYSTTISSGTYSTVTGLVTLTLAATLGVAPGDLVTVASATGTGAFASINGTFPAGAGTGGTTVTYTIAAALTMTITGGNANATTGLANGAQFWTTIAGASPAGYNGLVLATVASATTFTYAVPSGLSSATGTLTYTLASVAELQAMVNTYFGQGNLQATYVLELGAGTPAAGVTALTTYLTANPGTLYAALVPRSWAGESTFLTLVAAYEALTSKFYFFVTCTLSNYTNFTSVMKCVVSEVEAPAVVGGAEFSLAAGFYDLLSTTPSGTSKVAPFAFRYQFGVTSYPLKGNNALLNTLAAANTNVVGTGSQGGVSTSTWNYGTTVDGNDFSYWYSVDWVQINLSLDVSNAVINGSNNPVNPLYYNQPGINTLQQVAAATLETGVAYGLVLGQVVQTQLTGAALDAALDAGTFAGLTVINAVPFIAYSQANPNDYATGTYNGLSAIYVPARGFRHILFNVIVSNFAIA